MLVLIENITVTLCRVVLGKNKCLFLISIITLASMVSSQDWEEQQELPASPEDATFLCWVCQKAERAFLVLENMEGACGNSYLKAFWIY